MPAFGGKADILFAESDVRYGSNSGKRWILARYGWPLLSRRDACRAAQQISAVGESGHIAAIDNWRF